MEIGGVSPHPCPLPKGEGEAACGRIGVRTLAATEAEESRLSAEAKRRMVAVRGEPLLLSDWVRALFIHFEVDPSLLQGEVPFSLDLRGGKAYVSLVAFTMRRMRPRFGGRFSALCLKPIATHELLNLRTYVRHRGEPGIYFLAEWIPNRLSVLLGPPFFGLPYRLARLSYEHRHEQGDLTGVVDAAVWEGRDKCWSERTTRKHDDGPPCAAKLVYQARLLAVPGEWQSAPAGSAEQFLLERYTAFTQWGGRARFFRVWHAPWQQMRADVCLLDDSLLKRAGSWFATAKLAGANYSPGVRDVWMGWPHRLRAPEPSHSTLSGFFEMP